MRPPEEAGGRGFRLVLLAAGLILAVAVAATFEVPAAGPPSLSGACEPRDLYRDEVVYRLRQVQRYLVDHAPDGFAYDPGPAARVVDEVFAAGGGICGDGWWSPVAAEAVHRLSRAGVLDPGGERDAWLQTSYDAVALALGFEALRHEQEREVAAVFEVLDLPRERPRVVASWSRLRLELQANLEHPRTAELQALARSAEAGPPPRSEAGGPLVLAHQGGSRRFPPNTLAAFAEARALGADGVECDLRLSRDGEVFVLHDDRLADPAGPSGKGTVSVRESPAARLRELFLLAPLDIHGPSAEHPLTLRELLADWDGGYLWLELKPDGGEELPDRVGDLLAEAATRRGGHGEIVVSSLSRAMVAPLRRRFPDLLVAYESIDVDRAAVEAHAGSPDSARLILSVQHFAARAPEALRRARELGLRTSSFTPNRFDDLERALAAGIDFIQTDRPDRALWLRARRAPEPVEAPVEAPADTAPGAPP